MKQKGFIPILILVLIALAIAGYFGYKNYWPKIQNLIPPTPTANLSRAESKDWKTYNNDQYKFSFKYPNFLQLTEGNTSRNVVTVGIPNADQIGIMGCAPFQFSVGIIDDNEWNELQKTKEFKNPQTITVNNVTGMRNDWDYPLEGNICYSSLVIIPPHSTNNSRYSLSGARVQSQYQDNFDQILSTFRLTQ